MQPGMVLIEGGNGHGKSNLLEALYLLAIVKSPRTSADRELLRREAPREEAQFRVSAVAHSDSGEVRVQIDFRSLPASDGDGEAAHGASVQKYVRVNGVPRRTSQLVGEINAVMFSAHDLDLVLGRPAMRRRYLDILISQLDSRYLRALQRYQRILSQRNHLLRSVRAGHSHPNELGFWDDELITEGSYIMSRRAGTVLVLSQKAGPIHRQLTGGGEELELTYRPSISIGPDASEEELGLSLRMEMELQRGREVAQGFTVCGPHRDDLQMALAGLDAALYASRGQCRTVALAMKLAEASYLRDQRGQEPILLLDDVLSELDSARRSHVLDRAAQYQQCFITTADADVIGPQYSSQMSRLVVERGRVEPVA